jgi:hypothetical protein
MSNSENSPSPLHLTTQPTTRIDKSEQTRTAILNAALDFLWSRPFREMTVNQGRKDADTHNFHQKSNQYAVY